MTVSRLVGGVLSGGVSCEISAMGGHPSVRPTWEIDRASPPTFGLAPGGVCLAARVAPGAGALLPHRFTLACAASSRKVAIGGLFSVALSCGSPRLGVTQHRALWSPDVPRTSRAGTRPPGRLATSAIVALDGASRERHWPARFFPGGGRTTMTGWGASGGR